MEGNYSARSLGSGRVYAEFTFTAPGSGTSVAVADVDGGDVVASIAHEAGTQIMTVTMNKKYNKVVDASVSVIGTDGTYATIGSISNEGSATVAPSFTIYTWDGDGTVNNDNDDRITVRLALRYGSQGVK